MRVRELDIAELPPFVWSAALLVLLYAVAAIFVDGFGGVRSLQAVLLLGSFLGIAAAGETLVIISRGFDLSVPFVIGAANVVTARLYGDGMPFFAAVAIVLVGAFAIGAFHAIVSSSFGVNPLLITLGSGTALLGLVQFWTGGLPTGGAPDWLSSFVSIGGTIGPIPIPPVVLVWVGLAFVLVILLKRSPLGWRIYAYGANPQAAELSLVRPVRIWVYTFGFAAVLSAVTGILLLGFTGSAFAQVGDPYLFLVIAAVVVGGTAITGGTGGYIGTVIGTLVLTVLSLVFNSLGISSSAQQVFLGLILLVLVSIYGREAHVSDRI